MKKLDQDWEAIYPHPPERVWRALTDPKELAEWLLPSRDFKPHPGHRFQLRQGAQTIHGEVLTSEAPHCLSYTWRRMDSEEPLTVVTWRLDKVEGGTRLRLTHVSAAETVHAEVKTTFRTHDKWQMAI